MPSLDQPDLSAPVSPTGLQNILKLPATRPLDPNGVDVVGEIPMMRKAYATSNYGMGFGGRQEAGYTLQGSPGQYYHSQITSSPSTKMEIPTNSGTLALVHTHPKLAKPTPSDVDTQSAVPNYVFSGDKLFVTNPQSHAYSQYDIDKWNLAPAQTASKGLANISSKPKKF